MTCTRKILVSASSQVIAIPLLLPMIQVTEYLKTDSYILQVRKFQEKLYFHTLFLLYHRGSEVLHHWPVVSLIRGKGYIQTESAQILSIHCSCRTVWWFMDKWCYLFYILFCFGFFKIFRCKAFFCLTGKENDLNSWWICDFKEGKHTAIREISMKIPFRNTQDCHREFLTNVHVAANKAVNGSITAIW